MAETKSAESNFGVNAAYASSFGNLPDKTVYQRIDMKSLGSGKYEVDLRSTINEKATIGMKALATTAGGAGTAGYAMLPIFVDPRVIDTTRKYTPMVEIVPRVTNQGMFADWNTVTAKGGGFTAAEDGSLTEKDNTFDRNSKEIKFLYAVGRVTGPAIASMPSWVLAGINPAGGAIGPFGDQMAMNAKQLEVLLQTRAIRELEENLIVNGNVSSDATEFDGIIIQMGATNTVDKNTSALGLGDIDIAIQYAFDDGGRPNLAVCSSGVYTDLLGLLTAKIGYLQPTQQVFWGFSTIVLHTMVGDVPVIPSMFMSNASGSKAIYFLDMSIVEMRVLQDLSFQELAMTNDSEKFMLKLYEVFLIKNPAFCSSVTEINA